MAQNDEMKDETPKTAEPEKTTKSVAELEAEIARLKSENEKQRAAISNASSQAASYKRELREKQTEAEREAAERAEHEAQREARIAELEAKDRVNTYRDKLIAAGFDNDTAILMAQALPAGVSDDYFTAVKAHNDIQRQAIETATLKNQPGLSVGMPPTAADAQKEEMNRLRKSFGLKPLA